jgi:hypothetical protein
VLAILLILIGPFLVAAPGLLFAAIEAPEFFGRRPQRRPVSGYRWAPA